MSVRRTESRSQTSQKFSLQANQRWNQLQQPRCFEIKDNSAMLHGQSLLDINIPRIYPRIYKGIRPAAIRCTPDMGPLYLN